MRAKELTIIKWLAIAFLVIYLIHQFYSSVYNPLVTDMVVYDSSFEGVELETLFIRDETLISADDNGYKSYSVSEGGKVAKNGVIATVYQTAKQAELHNSILEIEKQIDVLKQTQNYTEFNNADLSLLNQKISTSFSSLLDSAKSGALNKARDSAGELLSNLNRKNIVTGSEQNFEALIAGLNSRLTELKAQHTASQDLIRAEDSGYFVSKTDGYEGIVDTKSLPTLTVEKFDAIKPSAVKDDVIGKIVSDYEWYILAKVPIEYSFHLVEGDKTVLKANLTTAQELTTTVESINREGDTEFAVIVFSCTNMNSELASTRWHTLTLVTESYSGLKVNKKAIRMLDGQKGVFTYTASQVHFVPVNIIYTTSSFVICEKGTDDNALRLYDEVIVKGKGLYDGKIIN